MILRELAATVPDRTYQHRPAQANTGCAGRQRLAIAPLLIPETGRHSLLAAGHRDSPGRPKTARSLLGRKAPRHHRVRRISPESTPAPFRSVAEQVVRNRDRYGLNYYAIHEPLLGAFAPVMDRVRALET